jgi:hypothetical protein
LDWWNVDPLEKIAWSGVDLSCEITRLYHLQFILEISLKGIGTQKTRLFQVLASDDIFFIEEDFTR